MLRNASLAFLLLIGLLLRLYFAASYHGTGDIANFERSATIFAHGHNIFAEQYYFNYSPAIVGPALMLARSTPLPFDLVWRVGLSLLSCLNIWLIRRRNLPLVLFNLAIILLDAYIGQFEALALLWLAMGAAIHEA